MSYGCLLTSNSASQETIFTSYRLGCWLTNRIQARHLQFHLSLPPMHVRATGTTDAENRGLILRKQRLTRTTETCQPPRNEAQPLSSSAVTPVLSPFPVL
ncbi:hypothetical protein PISMIDRAFT_687882 [Pisolithus microcarpus 441]|uniref:Uncharacterized protein n=1 Tax=Pisolithus microcarpus 441 TaxID=765257 RepID=A0A0C9Z3E1_9AGAM|nr:hypothetical protein PISMIDRAFT_687882 [Pisolithus microcarpus 441]